MSIKGRFHPAAICAASALAAVSFAQSGFINPPHYPEPQSAVLSHPRLFLTAADLPTYRSWAVPSNKIWKDLLVSVATAKQRMDEGKVPDLDAGSGPANYEPYDTEEYAELFAFMSLMDHSPAAQADWAKRAHDLVMYVIDIADQGPGAYGDRFRDPAFAVHNRSRWFGEAFPVVVDWCYSTFTPSDKAKIRRVFLRWIQENLKAQVTGPYDHPMPIGKVNTSALIADKTAVRWAANNYYCNHARQVGMLALALDPADDVPSGAGQPPAHTLRQFVGNSIGAWLKTVDYCERTFTKGGISPEGWGYGESDTSAIATLALALNTSGMDDPATYGPQAAIVQGDFWKTEFPAAFMHSMSPQFTVQYNYIGPSHLPADFGDNANYGPENYIRTFAPMALLARRRGDTATYDKYRWMIDEYEPGHRHSRDYQISSVINSYGPLFGMFYFMTVDPHEAAKPDPRPSMPVDYVAPGMNRVLSRSDWSADASWIDTKCGWITTDHNGVDANKIEFYRHGEWLTKGRMGYGFHASATDFQNTLCIQNYTPATTDQFWDLQASRGGQFSYNFAPVPLGLQSFGPGYAYTYGNATAQYNLVRNSMNADDVAHASRSIMYLKPDFVIVYDRAQSKSAGKFKRLFFNTTKLATVNGRMATAVTPHGQNLYISSLLPSGATLSAETATPSANGPDAGETAQGEPMRCRLKIENPNPPKAIQFLTVLQGADANANAAACTLVKSASGDAFDGVIVGTSMVLLKTNIVAAFTGASFNVPGLVQTVYVTGLKPGAMVKVTKNAVGANFKITLAPGGPVKVDAGGVIKI